MSSAAFPFERLGDIGRRVREVIGPEMPLLINTRDLSYEEALFLHRDRLELRKGYSPGWNMERKQ